MQFEANLTDYHHGQHDGHVIARTDGGQPRGLLEFSLFDGQVFINWIITHHEHRRQGIATGLIERLTAELADPLVWAMTTPDGTALRQSVERSQK